MPAGCAAMLAACLGNMGADQSGTMHAGGADDGGAAGALVPAGALATAAARPPRNTVRCCHLQASMHCQLH